MLGLVVGSIFSYSLYVHDGSVKLAMLTPIGNAVYGFLIELFTSVVFKQRAAVVPAAPARAVHA